MGHVLGGGRLSAIGALTSQVNITPPTLLEVTYKAKKQKLNVSGSGMQRGVTVVVGTTAYPAKPQSDDGTSYLAKGVPAAAFPQGVPTRVRLRNPDGGESLAITFTR